MAQSIIDDESGVPLKLYYTLEDGRTANAEVVARASLAFISGVKELYFVLDPSLKVQFGLIGHEDGSLWENLVIKFDKAREEYYKKPTRYGFALAAIIWLLSPPFEHLRDVAWQPFIEKYLPHASAEDLVEARKLIEIAANKKIATKQKEQFYREIYRDTGISGVSVNVERDKGPWIVQRAEFPIYSGQSPIIESELDRTTSGEMRVIILSPVLEVSNRRWKFATPQGEFGAVVRDKAFLEHIVTGQTSVRMRGGVELDVELETKERLVDGVWTVTERNVLRVIDIIEPPASRQSLLFPREGD
jgi:hypothetical protein